jgi:uncharacterized YigZ family protein
LAEKNKYKSIEKISTGIFKEKGSKFLAFAHPVSSLDEIKELVKHYKKEYFDARHHCFAYIINPKNEQTRAYDDGEPNNSAGIPILGQLKSADLCNVFVLIVRYFGGTKLGVSGLVNAYKLAAYDAIANAKIIELEIKEELQVSVNYEQLETVMKAIKKHKIQILKQESTEKVSLDLSIPLADFAVFKNEIQNLIIK